jgi:septum formation protein
MQKTFVLASQSPRRKLLLEAIGLPFLVDTPKEFQEIMASSGASAHELALNNAIGKAREVAQRHPNAIIIGVDTIGSYQDHILEKPKDHADAVRMLTLLQGKTHEVLSGLCVIDTASGKEAAVVESTHITFQALSPEDIEAYVNTGESFDKSASYSAQGIASIFVESFNGDASNVVGLPMGRLRKLLLEVFDINLIHQVQ